MHPTVPRAPRRSPTQWQALIDEQIASGLSALKFCQRHSIPYSSFMNWKNGRGESEPEHDRSATEAVSPTFIELTTPHQYAKPAEQEPHSMHIELDLGGGIHLRITRAG